MIRFTTQIPAVAARIPMVFDEKSPNMCKLTFPLMPNSVSAMEGTTAITQKNKAAMQNPSAKGSSTFIHLSKNKYCAVNMINLKTEMPSIFICSFVLMRFNSLPYTANLRSH